jgi:hypothetical protein
MIRIYLGSTFTKLVRGGLDKKKVKRNFASLILGTVRLAEKTGDADTDSDLL